MKTQMIISIAALCSACASNKTPQADPSGVDVVEQSESAPSPTGPTLVYHQFEGEPRAYVPLESGPCQKDDQGQVLFQPRAVWWFDPDAGDWTPVADVAGEVRITCNAMIAVEDVLGQTLALGTFAIVADVDGAAERGIFYNGEVTCNDVDLGRPPDGQVALCIGGVDSAEPRFVPDPGALSVDP